MWPPQHGRTGYVCSHISFYTSLFGQHDYVRKHVVNHVVLNDAVEDVAADEAKFTIDS